MIPKCVYDLNYLKSMYTYMVFYTYYSYILLYCYFESCFILPTVQKFFSQISYFIY